MNAEAASHRETRELLPWFVNERASEDECRRIAAHLAHCAECRTELEQQRRVRKLIASDTRIDSVPGASLQKLWARIDAQPADQVAASVEVAKKKLVPRFTRGRYLTGALAAAVTIEAVGLALLGSVLWSQASRAPAEYRTLSSPSSLSAEANVRAVFAPDMTLSQLQTLLFQLDLTIVDGPSASGVYSLKASRVQAAGDVAARLRSQPGVRFAEPINIATEHVP
jgi:anti-sigma factor RsiW